MKSLGIIGGIGPESTIDYYRLIISEYHAVRNDYPSIIINSIDLTKIVSTVTSNRLAELAEYLTGELQKLVSAGVDFAVLASNTPHIVFDEVQRRTSIPLLSIIEATCESARDMGLRRVGLLGTRFTMEGTFYPAVFSRAGISVVVPDEEDRKYIHEKYMGELLENIFLPETRERVLAIADKLRAKSGIEALILGGTELPLLLRDNENSNLPMLDTTRIHVQRILRELLA
jgi:aspartate racemase